MNKEILQKAIETYGEEPQIRQCMEECAELISAIVDYAENDKARIEKVLTKLEGQDNRRARFVCVIAIAINGEVIETFEGEVKGTIVDAPRGSNGFGYDPIFQPDGYDKTFAEMTDDEKNQISHRADAVRKALEFIEDEMSVLDADF